MRRVLLHTVLLLGCALSPLVAQEQTTVRFYTMEDGLPTANVRMLLEDAEGFIWCGSEEGLLRFDGHTFKVFRSRSDVPGGLSDNNITRLFLDQDGRMWVHTRRALHRYDAATQSFSRYPFTTDGGQGPGGRWDRGIMRTANGQLWVRTDKGMNLYDEQKDRFLFYPHNAAFTGEEDAAWAEKDGVICFVSGDRLWCFDTQDLRYTSFTVADIDAGAHALTRLHAVHRRSNGDLLVASTRALYSFDVREKTFQAVTRFPESVTSAIPAGDGLWCSMPDLLLLRYGLDDGSLRYFSPDADTDDLRRRQARRLIGDKPADRSLRLIAADRGNALWGIFPDNSLFRFLPAERRFERLVTDVFRGTEGFSSLMDRSGTFWFTAPGHGIIHIEKHRARFTRHALAAQRTTGSQVESNNVRAFLQWNADSVLVATLNGLYLYLPQSDRCQPLTGLPDAIRNLTKDAVWSLARDRNGRLWIGTGDHGLIVYDLHSRLYFRVADQRYLPRSLREARMRSITISPDGKAWMGTWDGGYVIDADSLALPTRRQVFVRRVAFASDVMPDATSSMILDVYYDRRGRQWVATDRGLLMTDTDGKLRRWTKSVQQKHGLVSDDIRAICEDGQGRIWLGTH
ncbi:MAG: two-component regulator propeller domain-containing protein, partial [Bacteroidota bacterium]|nr:two-component regulator propeller domain-containing protein [Bacteroidota bacterium]